MDDLLIKKELQWRKEVTSIYSKDLSDFDDDKQKYDDYLEEMEDLIYRLTYNVNADQAKQQLRRYKAQNQAQIASAMARKAEADRPKDSSQANPAQTSTQGSVQPLAMALAAGAALVAALPKLMTSPAWVAADGSIQYDRRPVKDKILYKAMCAAGGWTEDISRKRTLIEAFSSLALVVARSKQARL